MRFYGMAISIESYLSENLAGNITLSGRELLVNIWMRGKGGFAAGYIEPLDRFSCMQ